MVAIAGCAGIGASPQNSAAPGQANEEGSQGALTLQRSSESGLFAYQLKRSGGKAPASETAEPEWLQRLNAYRQAAGLKPAMENRAQSDADLKHAKYLVMNYRPEDPFNANMHTEDESKPGFSREGRRAGQTSDVIPPTKAVLDESDAIDGWLSAPFHALPMLDPDLTEAGFGKYCENGVCAAALNVGRGERWRHAQKLVALPAEGDDAKSVLGFEPQVLSHPIEFPPPQSVITNASFKGTEWPNPLTACPGYAPPTGAVIMISFGSGFDPAISNASVSTDGKAVESCLVTAENYKSSDKVAIESAKGNLKMYAAAFVIPREPLKPGTTYDVAVTKDDQTYNWSFKVEPKGLAVTK